MKKKIALFLFLCCFKCSELANKLIKLENGWNLAYPCKDNRKITMLIDNDEVTKTEFNFILSIQGISTYSDKITLQRETAVNANGVDYIEDKYDLKPGQMSFSTELKGHNGILPKVKSISIDGVNYCKEPDNPVVVSKPTQSYNTEGLTPTTVGNPIITNSPQQQADINKLSQGIEPATEQYSVAKEYPYNISVLSEGLNPALNETDNKDYDDDDFVIIATKMPMVDKDKSSKTNTVGGEGDATCGLRIIEHTGLIVNGFASKPGDWPWHAALYMLEKTSIRYICGGTLISKFIVLTAAHCVTESGVPVVPDVLNVVLGKYNLFGGNETPQDKRVFRIFVNENFQPNILKNDIALLKLSTEAIYNDYVQPACIWRDEYYSKLSSTNILGTLAGWGFDHTQSLSFVLQQAQLPKIPDKSCLTSNPTFFGKTLNEFNFCAGYRNGTSACNGDSGGGYHIFIPDNSNDLTYKRGHWYVHGIVSLAVALQNQAVCDPSHYVLFTDVGKFSGWIDEHL